MADAGGQTRRILALSGGGVRGIIEVVFLQALEAAYRRKLGDHVRLCDVFNLIGGTSTGSIIATALSLGLPLSDIADFYLRRAPVFFSRSQWWRIAGRGRFDPVVFEREVRRVVGDLTMGSDQLLTYLAVVTKRLDTGSPWIVSNLPEAPYFNDPEDGSYLGNRHYKLANLICASTAAPTLLAARPIAIGPDCFGVFVDGGLSPYNDPSLALLTLARMRRFGLSWPTGPGRLFVLSVGAGDFETRIPAAAAARLGALRVAFLGLRGMVQDSEAATRLLMEWMGRSTHPTWINSEIGRLDDETLAPEPLFDYLRLDLPLEAGRLAERGLEVDPGLLRRFCSLDDPEIIEPLRSLSERWIATYDLDALIR